MDDLLLDKMQALGLPTLQKLVGHIILKAIKSVNQGEDERAVATALLQKYDSLILNNKEIREAIINSLTLSDAIELCGKANIKTDPNYKAYNALIKYFNTAYNFEKSQILTEFLGLDTKYCFIPIVDSRRPSEVITAAHGEEIKILAYLHDYQKRVKDEVMVRLNQKNEKYFFVQMPTGAGKTFTALECVVDLMRKPRTLNEDNKITHDKFVVWLVDRNELAEQAMESFKKLWKIRGDHDVMAFRLFKDFEPDFIHHKGGVVFAGFDKLYAILKNTDHAAYDSVQHLINNSELLIIDEAHHSLAETYHACINRFREVPFIKIMGLSATPGTSDIETTQKLVELYSADKISIRDDNWMIVQDPIEYLQGGGYLARLTTKLLETGVTPSAKDEEGILDDLATNSERNLKVIEQIQLANANGESTVVFACSIDHVYALLVLCRAFDIKANFIIGEVDQSARIGILEDFKRKEYNILINLDILSTGIDLPNIDKVIIAKPIGSPNLISQILGRALRGPKNGGNEHNTIINIKDNLINFPGASFLYNYYKEEWQKLN